MREDFYNFDENEFYAQSGPHLSPVGYKLVANKINQVIKKGSKGPTVVALQEALNVGADGSFGSGTEKTLKAWQEENGLTADGIAGPKTLAKLLG
jgi:peptidoglycan hydrolase-like protein with peptidoglycan-binding domain